MLARQQVTDTIGMVVRSGMVPAGTPIPLICEMSDLQTVPTGPLRHAPAVLVD